MKFQVTLHGLHGMARTEQVAAAIQATGLPRPGVLIDVAVRHEGECAQPLPFCSCDAVEVEVQAHG